MSDENHPVLSSDEVDAILKVSKTNDHADLLQANSDAEVPVVLNAAALTNIADLTAVEFEKNIISFLRKKVLVKFKSFELTQLGTSISEHSGHHVYSIYRILPNEHYGMFILELPFLQQAINLLYGGQIESQEPVMEKPGKIGLIIAEKICSIFLASFVTGCNEYGTISYEILKTSALSNLTPTLTPEDKVYRLELSFILGEREMSFNCLLAEAVIKELLVVTKKTEAKHREKDFWRTAIKTQVVDSIVTVNVTLPDVTIKVNELLTLKPGDVIPISDPTLVYVCLNKLKLFRAKAGQSNTKRVAKIIAQI